MPVKVGASIPTRKPPVPATAPPSAPQQAATSGAPTASPATSVQSFTVRMQRYIMLLHDDTYMHNVKT